MFNIKLYFLVILLTFFLSGCTGTKAGDADSVLATPEPHLSNVDPGGIGSDEIETVPSIGEEDSENLALVEKVEVLKVDKKSGRAEIMVSGMLPDPCTEISEVKTDKVENTFNITVTTYRDPEAMCAMVIKPFEEKINININDIDPGNYIIDVNSITSAFELK
jgi:PBP1b-binding outer membrane lipoprotein LpoB